MCSTSSREPWKALLAVTAPSTSQIGRHAALARGRGALDHDAGRAHPEDHPVAAPVERQRGLLDDLVGGRGARGQEARADPRQQRVGGHVVGGHDHARAGSAPRGSSPRRARRACVVLAHAALICVFGPRAPISSANWECPIESTRNRKRRSKWYGCSLEVALELGDPAVDLVARRAGVGTGAHLASSSCSRARFTRSVQNASISAAKSVDAREGGGEDHAGVVAQRVRQPPLVGQLGAARRVLVVLDERDAGVAQRVDAGGDRQLRLAPERREAVGVDAELLGEVERRRRAPASLITSAGSSIVWKRAAAVLALDEARDVALGDLAAHARRDHVDELLAVQQPREVAVVEDLLGAGRADRGAGDDHRLVVARRPPARRGAAAAAGSGAPTPAA